MAQQVTFQAQRREVMGKAVKRLRRQGIVPANIYGHGRASVPIQLNTHDFERFLAAHAPTTVLRLTFDGSRGDTAVVRHVQHEPATGAIQHIDFMHVEMSEPIRARIPVRLVGDAPAVKTADGLLLQVLDTVEVEALPARLPEAIDLDVSGLTELNALLHVSDLKAPPSVTILTDPEEVVAKIEPPRVVTPEEEAVTTGVAGEPVVEAAENAETPEAEE